LNAMKIAVVLDRWRAGGGGLETYLERVLPPLAERHTLVLVARGADRDPPRGVLVLPAATRAPLPRPLRDAADARVQAQAVRELGPDRIWSLRRTPCEDALFQPHGGSAPHLRRARGHPRAGLREGIFERLEAAALQHCGGLLAMSPKVMGEFAERRPDLKAAVLPPPLADDLPRPRPPDRTEGLRILFCGRDARLKGAAQALAWFFELRRREPAATLTMWARSRAHLRRVLRRGEAELGSCGVRLRGWDGGFRGALPGAGALFHPTRYDACSLAGLEALGAGVPVVTTSGNGLAGLVQSPLLAVTAAGDPARAAEMARQAMARARDDPAGVLQEVHALRGRFSLAAHLARLEEHLRQGPAGMPILRSRP